MELEHNQDEFRKRGITVAAVSYDSVPVLHTFAERKGIHFPLLSDPDSGLIRELNILNDTVPKDNAFYGIPFPGSFLLDAKGVIVAKYFDDDYKQRFTSADILAHQFGIFPDAGATEVAGRQLSLTSVASNSTVAPGQRLALALNIELKPGMHVYAPGVEGYIAIDWQMKESDATKAEAVKFPASEMLHLQAIDETVPVYRGEFRLTRDIIIGQDAKVKPLVTKAGELTIEGKLRYQACDDRVCYIPQELPLKWTFHYEDLDRQRVPTDMQRKPSAAGAH